MKVKCKHCDYKWATKSKMLMVSCPCCGNKVNINESKDGAKK